MSCTMMHPQAQKPSQVLSWNKMQGSMSKSASPILREGRGLRALRRDKPHCRHLRDAARGLIMRCEHETGASLQKWRLVV